MKRRLATTDDMPGQDSFLDVVANIVGILIILVMVVGVRAANTPSEVPPSDMTARAAENSRLHAKSLITDLDALEEQAFLLQGDVAARRLEREQLDMLAVAAEKELENRRERLDADAQRDFDALLHFP